MRLLQVAQSECHGEFEVELEAQHVALDSFDNALKCAGLQPLHAVECEGFCKVLVYLLYKPSHHYIIQQTVSFTALEASVDS